MREEELKKGYKRAVNEYNHLEDMNKTLKSILKQIQNDDPNKIIDRHIDLITEVMKSLAEDIDWYLVRLNEVDNEKK